MKSSRPICLAIAALVIAGAAGFYLWSTRPPQAPLDEALERQPTPIPIDAVALTAPSTQTGVVATNLTIRESASSDQGTTAVEVRSDQVLATVNGMVITLKDLVSLPHDGVVEGKTFSIELFDSLLRRAIDRELVFQVARQQGVSLTDDQARRLARMRGELEFDRAGVTRLNTPAGQSEFDLRDVAGLMLQANLAAQAGVPSLHVLPQQVERHYHENQSRYGDLPADPIMRAQAWQKLDLVIRRELSSTTRFTHEEGLRSFMEELRARHKIDVAKPQAAHAA